MSVAMMSAVYAAHFHDITFLHKGKKKTGEPYERIVNVMNFNLKSVCVALADHANDQGEGAYPAIETISSKTELSDVTVVACLKAMKQEKIITYIGRSKWDTCNYTINKAKLVEMVTWERQKREKVKSKATLPPPESKATSIPIVKPLQLSSKAALYEPSETILKPKEAVAEKTAPAPLSLEELQSIKTSANKTMEGILENERKVMELTELGQAWRGRELLPPHYIPFADWWHATTKQHMYGAKSKQKINAEWLKAFKEWWENDLTTDVLAQVYDAEKAWKGVIGKPSELTTKAIALQALPAVVETKFDNLQDPETHNRLVLEKIQRQLLGDKYAKKIST